MIHWHSPLRSSLWERFHSLLPQGNTREGIKKRKKKAESIVQRPLCVSAAISLLQLKQVSAITDPKFGKFWPPQAYILVSFTVPCVMLEMAHASLALTLVIVFLRGAGTNDNHNRLIVHRRRRPSETVQKSQHFMWSVKCISRIGHFRATKLILCLFIEIEKLRTTFSLCGLVSPPECKQVVAQFETDSAPSLIPWYIV